MNSMQESAWLAGLLEGEGHFRMIGNTARVELEMTDLDVVERATMVAPLGPKAKIRSRTRADHERAKRIHRASWCGQQAINVMRRVQPYMGERRKARINECLGDK